MCRLKGNYLEALQQHLSSQLARQLSRGPRHGGGPFSSLPERSRFGSKRVHEEEAQLHQALSHMVPAEHAADHREQD